MTKPHSTAPAAADKPAKPGQPYPEFPLFPHAAGVWAKKIRGKLHDFGPWADPDADLAKSLEPISTPKGGRRRRPTSSTCYTGRMASRSGPLGRAGASLWSAVRSPGTARVLAGETSGNT